jgi:ATP:cob(I)alamin adenosyltransferase
MDIKKSNVYTKTGDKGTTSLVGGTRVMKSDTRLEAYGSIDELNAFLGLLNCDIEDTTLKELFLFIQRKLFTIGAILATEDDATAQKYGCKISQEDVKRLEEAIDIIDAALPRLKVFTIPGGNKPGALAHVSRTVCRRAERRIIALNELSPVSDELMVFVNRLSDLLYVLSRKLILDENQEEIFWTND